MNEYEDIHITVARDIDNLILDCLKEHKNAREEPAQVSCSKDNKRKIESEGEIGATLSGL